MPNPEHVAIVKQGAATIRQWRETHPDEQLDLTEAYLPDANLQGAILAFSILQDAILPGAILLGANLSGAMLLGADLQHANLAGANLSGAILFGANLAGANLSGAILSGAVLSGAVLKKTNLQGANLHGANLQEAKLQGANLSEAILTETDLHAVQGACQARLLETVRFVPIDSPIDARYFETCQRSWCERWLDWERLRIMGRLPLFGASYTALTFILIVFYGLQFYANHVALARAWAEQVMPQPDHLLHQLASLVLAHLHHPPVPQQSLWLLVSTLFLVVGSTLYTFSCPSRIKEFSRDQWCDQLGRSLLHYWPLAWKYRPLRLVCAVCYALGGTIALGVLGTKAWRVLLFILKYSSYPWLWR